MGMTGLSESLDACESDESTLGAGWVQSWASRARLRV